MKNDAPKGGKTIRGMKTVMLLCVTGALLANGCMSARVTTNLKPETNPELKSPAGRFYVAGLKYTDSSPEVRVDPQTIADTERRLLPLVRKECASRYPALFVDDAASSSIPLGVEVNHTITIYKGKMLGWMLGTVDMCGLIFPCPADQDEDFDVKAGAWNGRSGLQGAPLQKSFKWEEHIWVSALTPLALITIPGESDFPKMSGTVFNIQEQTETSNQRTAQQVATALAQLVAAKEAGFWVVPVGGESTPPTESAAPF